MHVEPPNALALQSTRRRFLMGTALAALAGQSLASEDGGFPRKPVRLVVPYPPGGGADNVARLLAPQLASAWKVPVVIDNKPGASGMIGNDAVAKAMPDGHTVLLGIAALAQMPSLYSRLPYDVMRDLVPLSEIALTADLLMVSASLPARSVRELADLVRANGQPMEYGSYGNATSSHMHGEQLRRVAGVDLLHVPYAGAGPEMAALLDGQVRTAFVEYTAANPHLASPKLRVLATTGTRRHPALPSVPTLGEQGFSGFEANGWFGAFVPAGTPASIVRKLSEDIAQAARSPEVAGRLSAMGLVPTGTDADSLRARLERDLPHWSSIVKGAGIRLD